MADEEHKILAFYEADSKIYDASRFQSRAGRELDLIQQTIFNDLCGDIESKTILELATGTGRFTSTLAKKNATIMGVDVAISMLKITRKKLSNINSNKIRCLVRADITRLPFRDNSFDNVICINALNHIPRYLDAIKEASRVVKPKGFFIANFPCSSSFLFPIAFLVNATLKSVIRPVFSKWFALREILLLLFLNDLEVKEIQGHMPIDFIPFFKINNLIRKSFFRYLAGLLFVKAQKIL